MNKKGITWGWEVIGKIILVLVIIVILIIAIGLITGKSNLLLSKIGAGFGFGG